MALSPEKQAQRNKRYKHTMEKRKAATIKPITTSTLAAVTATVIYSEFYDWNDMQLKLFTNTTAETWAKELLEYVKNPSVFKATEYIVGRGIDMTSFYELCEKYEILAKAYKQAKMVIGNRREIGGLKNELNTSLVHAGLAHYDPEWRADVEWRAKLKNDQSKDKGTVNVLIERYPETAIVPVKEIAVVGEEE